MKNFRQLVNELPSRKIVFAFGRFQPPTVGHELLVKAVQRVAAANKADHVIYTSRSVDKKKNPLDVKRKVYYLRRMFPTANIMGAGDDTRTFIEVAKALNKKYKQLVMIAGSDRIAEYERILNGYNGKEFNFETIQVVSAGERDPDADDASGMSGTKMRELAKKGDFSTFKTGLPSTLTTADARRLMNDIRTGLGMEAIKEDVKFETDLLREMYHKGDIFLVGQFVESAGQQFEILDRGANYLSVVDSSGNISKKWLTDVRVVQVEDYTPEDIITNEISYKGFVAKNIKHQTEAVDAFQHTIAKQLDPVATLIALKATDAYMKIHVKAINTDKMTRSENAEFFAQFKKAGEALSKIGELNHHADYMNGTVHDMERIATQYHTDTDEQGQESYIPAGELLEMKFMSSDKIKVARIIATTLGVADVEKSSSPTQLVNAGLRVIRKKPMRPEYLEIVKKMLQTATDAGIEYDAKLLPQKAQDTVAEAAEEIATSDTKLDKKGRKIPAHKIVFNPSEAEYQKNTNESYDDNRTGFAKKKREDDEGYGKPKFKAKSMMDRPHTVHIDGKPWKKFDNGHQAHKAAETLTANGKKATAIAHFKEEVETIEESMTDSWKRVQSMDKGSVTGGKDEVRKRLSYLNAVHAHHKKFGNDTKKVKGDIERINRSRIAEETISESAYEKAEKSKHNAELAKGQARPFDYHMHMADHHDNMSQWHAEKGRHGEADRHAQKSDEHHEKAMNLKEEVQIDEAAGHTIEAHGIKGTKGTPWRKTFKSHDHLNDWAEKNDSVEVHGTRDLEGAKKKTNEETVSEAKAGFNGSGGIMNYNDFKQSLAMNSGKKVKLKPETAAQADPVMSSMMDKPSATADAKEPHTQSGHSYSGDESLRRRKAYHKMHEEVTEKNLDGMEDDEESFNDDIEKISEPEHIMHLYDDSEFIDNDDDETEDADEDEKEEVNEAIGRQERIKRGIRFKRTEAKRERRKEIALKRMSNSTTINSRARRHAVQMMKQRLARKPLDKLSVQEKERLENFVSKRKDLITRLAKRIAPKIRQIEKTRLQRKTK